MKSTADAPSSLIRFATYNVGLLQLFSKSLVPLAGPRSSILPTALATQLTQHSIDVIFLQEVWSDRDARNIRNELTSLGYQVIRPTERAVLGTGLLLGVKSPFQVESCHFYGYESAASSDRFARKGVLSAVIQCPWQARFAIVGTHMQSLSTKNGVPTQNAEVQAHRQQLRQLKSIVDSYSSRFGSPIIVMGDFNVGPGYVEDNFSELLSICGLQEPYLKIKPQDFDRTWDHDNLLVQRGFNSHEPSSLVDHCFTRDGRRSGWKVISADVILKDAHSDLYLGGQNVPLSDHYALAAALELPSERP